MRQSRTDLDFCHENVRVFLTSHNKVRLINLWGRRMSIDQHRLAPMHTTRVNPSWRVNPYSSLDGTD